MNTRNSALDQLAINTFALEKVLILTEVCKILLCSPITAHRRLKEWGAYTSYNKNGRYYTIGAIPEFNENGIWQYKDIYFSRYGTLKNTVIALTVKSKKGLNHAELQEIIGLNPKCFMARFKELSGIKRERYKNTIIYFSDNAQTYEAQQRNRFPPEPAAAALPPDAQAIIILVELIHNPGKSIDELAAQLEKKGTPITSGSVAVLFKKYRIDKKKLNMKW